MILKICGITNQDDASAAIDAGATAVGFNFYARSPRYIAPEQASEIATVTGVRRVGVFVNEKRELVEEIVRAARLDVAQLHGDETPAEYPGGVARVQRERVEETVWTAGLDVAQLQGNEAPAEYPGTQHRVEMSLDTRSGVQSARATLAVWKALAVREGFDISRYDDYPLEALLLDGPGAGAEFGGQGKTFDWTLVRETKKKIVLVGGLNASNIALAIARVRPWGVDCCSLIEKAPGKKDHKKMKEFLHAARLAAL